MITTLRLAVADLLHDWRISSCQILALAAVLAPLLVLFGLKSGIVSTLRERLVADPLNLEVQIVGSYRLEPAWFEQMAADGDTGFVVPRTRSLAATLDLMAGDGKALEGVELVPSAAGDPLLHGLAPPSGHDVILSHSAARRLGVATGDGVTGLLSRTLRGERQGVRVALTVAAVLPEAAFARDGVFAALPLLVRAEDWRDGNAVDFAAPDAPTPGRTFASARLFARGLDAVAPLADRLRGLGLEVRTRAAEIALVKAVDHTLTVIFSVVAGIAMAGTLLSLAASLWANVDRKRRDLALLRLVGFPTLAAVAFPAIQALAVAAAGIVLSILTALPVAAAFNTLLAGNLAREEFVCRLLPADLAWAALATLLLALTASSIGGYRAARIDPAESLRDY